MRLLRSLLLSLALVATLRGDDAPAAYDVVVAGGIYRVLSADAADGYRVTTPDGRTIGIPAADPAAPLTAEALAAHLANPQPPAVAVPAEVGAGQIRAAMIAIGIAADVDALDALIATSLEQNIANATERAVALALWRHAGAFKRDNAFVLTAATALGKTSAEIDDLFRLAATF
jgi:hypothetical protein